MAKKKSNKKKKNTVPQKQAPAKKHTLAWVIAAVCVVAVVLLAVLLWPKSETETPSDTQMSQNEQVQDTEQEIEPPQVISPAEAQDAARDNLESGVAYYADIDIQDYGTITVALDTEDAPITVLNFVQLAESGFYDGLTFHRIMEGFMMQGGDPLGNGTGGSDMQIEGEFTDNGFDNQLSHTRGVISMARSSDYNSASSQFFIVHEDSTFLDGQYAAFGYVTDGMDVVDAVCAASQPVDGNGTIPSNEQPVMNSVTIRMEPIAE